MTAIKPLDINDITDPELKELVEKCEALGVPGGEFPRIVARMPEQAKALLRVMLLNFNEGNVDHRLKEIIRVQLARYVEEPYNSDLRSLKVKDMGLTEEMIDAGSGDYEDSELFTESEKVALRYADQMFLDSSKVDKELYDELKKHYTEAQVMELGAFIALFHGAHIAMRSFGSSQ